MTRHHSSAPAHHASLPPTHGHPRMSAGERRKAFGEVQGFEEFRGPVMRRVPTAFAAAVLALVIVAYLGGF